MHDSLEHEDHNDEEWQSVLGLDLTIDGDIGIFSSLGWSQAVYQAEMEGVESSEGDTAASTENHHVTSAISPTSIEQASAEEAQASPAPSQTAPTNMHDSVTEVGTYTGPINSSTEYHDYISGSLASQAAAERTTSPPPPPPPPLALQEPSTYDTSTEFYYEGLEAGEFDTVTFQTMVHMEDMLTGLKEESETEERGVKTPHQLGRNRHIAVMNGAFIGFKPDWYTGARDILMDVLSNKTKYKVLLSWQEDTLQLVLDLMQMVIDHPNSLDTTFGNIFLKAMLRVSKQCTLCPRSYILSGIKRDEYPVASGHFGEVFQGDYNGQKVSLKVFKLYASEMSKINLLIKAFYKEAILWRHLSHPNLLPFYGIYQLSDSGKRICLVSPWMSNGNITQYLQRNSNANRLHLTLDIARGISYLHEKSVVHGDLKGVNVLISDSGVACLADFGLSTVINSTPSALVWTSVETTKSNAGTVRWQAPELIGGDDDDSLTGRTKESDIYAFACVCYEVFVGKIPFYQYTLDATVIRKVMLGQRPLQPVVDSDPYTKWGVTDWVWSLIEECWCEEPAARPTASSVVAKLSSRNEFLREGDDDRESWGDLRPEAFRPLVHQRPSLLEVDIQHCMLSLLNTL